MRTRFLGTENVSIIHLIPQIAQRSPIGRICSPNSKPRSAASRRFVDDWFRYGRTTDTVRENFWNDIWTAGYTYHAAAHQRNDATFTTGTQVLLRAHAAPPASLNASAS